MNELQIFTYNGNEVRTVQHNGDTWWVLKDVCTVLDIGQAIRVAERLDEDEVSQTHITDSLGRNQNTYIINESGLYNVILRSDKPEAKPFRKWVTSEVLPSIRKHGAYMTPETLEQAILNPDTMIKVHKFIPVTLETGIANIATPTPNQPTCVIETNPDKRYEPFSPNEYLASK